MMIIGIVLFQKLMLCVCLVSLFLPVPLSAPVAEDMSEEDLQEKALSSARLSLSGKTELERAAVLHQHIGSRTMGDMVIETFTPNPGKNQSIKLYG